MVRHGAGGEHQEIGNLTVAVALRDQVRHLLLARRQAVGLALGNDARGPSPSVQPEHGGKLAQGFFDGREQRREIEWFGHDEDAVLWEQGRRARTQRLVGAGPENDRDTSS